MSKSRTWKIGYECNECHIYQIIKVHPDDYIKWSTGTIIQDAMPYLTPDESEIMISGMCGKCFNKFFGIEEGTK